MRINIQLPEELKNKVFCFRAEELDPAAIQAIVDCLEENNPSDERIRPLKALWEELQ